MTAWTDEEVRAVDDARALLQRWLLDHLGDTCADCGQVTALSALPVRLLTDHELVACLPVGACTYCAELRALNPPA